MATTASGSAQITAARMSFQGVGFEDGREHALPPGDEAEALHRFEIGARPGLAGEQARKGRHAVGHRIDVESVLCPAVRNRRGGVSPALQGLGDRHVPGDHGRGGGPRAGGVAIDGPLGRRELQVGPQKGIRLKLPLVGDNNIDRLDPGDRAALFGEDPAVAEGREIDHRTGGRGAAGRPAAPYRLDQGAGQRCNSAPIPTNRPG